MPYLDPVAGAAREALNASGLDSTEAAYLNGVTAGTVAASKGVVVDANKDVGTFRHVTLSGNLVSGSTTIDETDIAKIDGITNGTTAASKAVVADANVKVSGLRRVSAAKTAAYTITAADSGKVLTNRGAGGSVTFTLPTVAAGFDGVDVLIVAVADQAVVVSAQTAGQIAAFNDATANSVALQTSSEIIGGGFRCICDGTSWLVLPMTEETQTVTVTT